MFLTMRLFIVFLFVCLSIWGEKLASATNQNRSQSSINPYHVLEIQKDASQDEIRKVRVCWQNLHEGGVSI